MHYPAWLSISNLLPPLSRFCHRCHRSLLLSLWFIRNSTFCLKMYLTKGTLLIPTPDLSGQNIMILYMTYYLGAHTLFSPLPPFSLLPPLSHLSFYDNVEAIGVSKAFTTVIIVTLLSKWKRIFSESVQTRNSLELNLFLVLPKSWFISQIGHKMLVTCYLRAPSILLALKFLFP